MMFFRKHAAKKNAGVSQQQSKAILQEAIKPQMEGLEKRQMLTVTLAANDQANGLQAELNNYPTINGAGETVVIIDGGGLAVNHPALVGKTIYTWDFDTNNSDVYPYDNNAHATGVAGEIAASLNVGYDGKLYQGVASGANIIDLRARGTTDEKAALDWVVAHQSQYNIASVNWTDFYGDADFSQMYGELQSLKNSGVFVSTPAGNYSGIAGAIAGHLWYQIGAVENNGAVTANTPTGPNIDMFAPGDITSLTLAYNGVTGYYYGSGTSWSTPQVTATVALIKQVNQAFTTDQVYSILRNSATWVYDPQSGVNIPTLNVNNAVALAISMSSQAGSTTSPTPTSTPTPTTTSSVPNGPFGLSATANGTSVNLAFYSNSSNETGFLITRSTNPSSGFSQVATLGASSGPGSVVTYTDSSTSGNTTYYYRVYAVSGSYQSGAATASTTTAAPTTTSLTTTNPGGVPNGPFMLSATSGTAAVNIAFYSNSTNETGFVLMRSTNSTSGFTQIATLPAVDTSHAVVTYSDTNVTHGTTYYYQAYAVNGQYSSSTAGGSVTYTGATTGTQPSIPTSPIYTPTTNTIPNSVFGLSIASTTSSSITLSFYDNANNEQAYLIERASYAGGPFSVIATDYVDQATSQGTGQRTYTDSGLSGGTTYYYRVTAINQIGYSNAVYTSSSTN